MPVTKFPDPRETEEDGIVAIGGDLHPDSLALAYGQGIFPWPDPSFPMMIWQCPAERAILEFDALRIPKSLEKFRRKAAFRYSLDQAFEKVIRACAEAYRPGQAGTWITDEMIEAYIRFHELGRAHSIEVWENDELVGGLYGVDCGGAFAGESMFHRRPNASKLAILHLVEHLKAQGLSWIDIQQLTPHMEALGARAISRDAFLDLLAETRSQGLSLF